MSKEFARFVCDQLAGRFPFRQKRMFGEECLFLGGKIVAIINADIGFLSKPMPKPCRFSKQKGRCNMNTFPVANGRKCTIGRFPMKMWKSGKNCSNGLIWG